MRLRGRKATRESGRVRELLLGADRTVPRLVLLETLLPSLNLRGKGVNIVVADDGLERTHVDIAPNYRAGKKS